MSGRAPQASPTPRPQGWYWCADGVSRYWDGTQWILDSTNEQRSPGLSQGGYFVVVSFIVAIVALVFGAVVIRNGLDWAVCPGLSGGCGITVSPSDFLAAWLIFGLPVGLIATGRRSARNNPGYPPRER